jgi:predicted TIM-barrel fold metal-dependent hydrolase
VRVDTHVHVYATAEQGLFDTSTYPITEYGEKEDVRFGSRAGTIQDALDALDAGGIDYAAMLGSFELPALPHPPDRARFWPDDPAFAEHHDALVDYNRWLCAVGAEHARLLPFITVNPAVMTSQQSARHVADLIDNQGARGMKLHTIGIRTYLDDPGLAGTFDVCQERSIPIVVHCGPDARGFDWATPASFVPTLKRFPRLPFVLAHLGGAAWRDIAEVAAARPQLWFDLSEIVNWTGSQHGATPAQLVSLIESVGVERVMLGSDFPWYEPADTAALVAGLPGLSADARRAILGENAARLLGIS